MRTRTSISWEQFLAASEEGQRWSALKPRWTSCRLLMASPGKALCADRMHCRIPQAAPGMALHPRRRNVHDGLGQPLMAGLVDC